MALVARFLIDTSVLARMNQPAVAAPVVPLIDAGLVGTCSVLDLEARYGARSIADYEVMRMDRARGTDPESVLPVRDPPGPSVGKRLIRS